MRLRATGAALLALVQAGCTSMSGLGGSSSYACKAPEGVTCDSVAGTYANAVQNNLPSQRGRGVDGTGTDRAQRAPGMARAASSPGGRAAPPADPGLSPMPAALRSAPRVLRLWFKPWEDADNDLYDQGYVYVQVDAGRWQVEHVQRQIRESYAPLKAPPRATSGSDAPSGSNPARPTPRGAAPASIAPLVPTPNVAAPRPADPRVPVAPDESNE